MIRRRPLESSVVAMPSGRTLTVPASRLSTYENGRVTLSAALLVRMRRVAAG